jgi:hypothetical protein
LLVALMGGCYYDVQVPLATLHCYNEQHDAGGDEPVHSDGPPLDDDEEEKATMLPNASLLNDMYV